MYKKYAPAAIAGRKRFFARLALSGPAKVNNIKPSSEMFTAEG